MTNIFFNIGLKANGWNDILSSATDNANFNLSHQVIDGNSLSDLCESSLENGSTLVKNFTEDFFQLSVISDEQGVNLLACVVQVLTGVVSG